MKKKGKLEGKRKKEGGFGTDPERRKRTRRQVHVRGMRGHARR